MCIQMVDPVFMRRETLLKSHLIVLETGGFQSHFLSGIDKLTLPHGMGLVEGF